jgi:hypothetical protein
LREHIALIPGVQVEIFFPCIATVIGGKSGLSLRFDAPGLAKAVKGTTKPKRRPAGRLAAKQPARIRALKIPNWAQDAIDTAIKRA